MRLVLALFTAVTGIAFVQGCRCSDTDGDRPPRADAGADQTVTSGDLVTLDGSRSTGQSPDDLVYSWSQTGETSVTLSDGASPRPTFTAPAVQDTTVLVFRLTVSEGQLSDTDTVAITVENPDSQALLLKNDEFVDGGTVAFSAGFVAGEEGAATLGPVADTFTVKGVTLMFGGAPTNQTVTLKVYKDAGTPDPGAVLFQGDFMLTGTDSTLSRIDLTSESVVVPGGGSIRVSLLFHDDSPPTIGRDVTAPMGQRNWVKETTRGWTDYANLSGAGNFIIRAEVEKE
jgi:hypothetical protein